MSLYHYLAMAVLVVLATVPMAETMRRNRCSRLRTFNTAMLPLFDKYNERRTALPDVINATNTDVYCLQEYWQECDIEELLMRVNKEFPYHYSAIQTTLNPPKSATTVNAPCSASQLQYFQREVVDKCAQTNGCLTLFSQDPALGSECIATHCATELLVTNITTDCISCIAIYGRESLTDGIQSCSPKPGCNKRLNPPGLVLLSKKNITAAKYVSFFPGRKMAVQRGYLEAEVEGIGKVLCTHLTSPFPTFFEYDSEFDNYTQQQSAEIDKLVKGYDCVDHILMGDFNTGPSIAKTKVVAKLPDHYQRLIDSSYSAPYSDMPGKCTFCSTREIVDHIFLKGNHLRARSAKRVLRGSKSLSLSDHFGVEVEVCTPKNQ